ncbi:MULTISPECIES: replication restart helicase PriA [Holospora]|uniref:Replication restart protein PriA n=2 Tax=Holospora TaxID=44747 RepID=A0A061JIT1_9PROT|nr:MULTISPECIES: primosomal protein N' [Holospora]ETZ05104.1 primosomal protein N' [Holospora undulata HU1]GAJ46207.1 primosomal protein N' [Holospora elegans E1]
MTFQKNIQIISVLLPIHSKGLFSYISYVPVELGNCVKVSFGSKHLWGIVWSLQGIKVPNLKEITHIHPHWKASSNFMAFLHQCSDYTLIPLGSILRMVFPVPEILDWPFSWLKCEHSFSYALQECPWPGTFAQWVFSYGLQRVKKWIENAHLTSTEMNQYSSRYSCPILTPHQQSALKNIGNQTTFIEGITGSGKTEVCLSFIKSIVDAKKQVLILVPEISLCQQWVQRIERYYTGTIGIWHSELSEKSRKFHGWNILTGHSSIIVGARSAVLLGYKNLGAIVVDEEHDGSYKQAEGPLYHGRDMAVFRGHHEKIPCLLMSATPSLESYWNIEQNRYSHVVLSERYGDAQLPYIHMLDLKQEHSSSTSMITLPLREALKENFTKKEQSLLFINRRGYASLWVCYQCGFRAACPNCSVWLSVHHLPKSLLMCHYCGFKKSLPQACPECCGLENLKLWGAGIEKIGQEVHSFLPSARICMLSSDICGTPIQLNETLSKIQNQQYDILIGTQLVAKGHHFPNLTLVGIIDGDFALSHLDLRSGERLYQVLCQVIGRAGREKIPGKAYIQTSQIQHPLFCHLKHHHIQGFLQEELSTRKKYNFPPYVRLVSLTFSGTEENLVHQYALILKQRFPMEPFVEILGPAPSLINPLRRRWRWRIFLKSPKNYKIQNYIRKVLNNFTFPSRLRLHIDVDPYDFL